MSKIKKPVLLSTFFFIKKEWKGLLILTTKAYVLTCLLQIFITTLAISLMGTFDTIWFSLIPNILSTVFSMVFLAPYGFRYAVVPP